MSGAAQDEWGNNSSHASLWMILSEYPTAPAKRSGFICLDATARVGLPGTAAIRQYLEANAWQVERIKAGIAAARKGRVRPADAVFGDIAAKHGW